jgi:prepilin-type N-terminal cleavage/methylation domain-containing protein
MPRTVTTVSPRSSRRRGFTLTELLVVIAIVVLVSAATLPVVMPTIRQRNVSAASLLLQGELARARIQAARTNQPRGIRLIPETSGSFAFQYFDSATGAHTPGTTPAYSRMIAIEAGSIYSEGSVTYAKSQTPLKPTDVAVNSGTDWRYKIDLIETPSGFTLHPLQTLPYSYGMGDGISTMLRGWHVLFETKFVDIMDTPNDRTDDVPASPTSWFWNIRRGDRIRVKGGDEWVIVGPMAVPQGPSNPEGYINYGYPGTDESQYLNVPGQYLSIPGRPWQEFLIVANASRAISSRNYDGIDNDLNGSIDPGFNSVDENGTNGPDDPAELFYNDAGEYESEEADITSGTGHLFEGLPYEIYLGAVPAKGSRELVLPAGMRVDMTTWNSTQERSRLPVDSQTGTIDIMFAPNGQVVRPVGGKFVPYGPDRPFLHFWLSDSDGIVAPLDQSASGVKYRLPMPDETIAYPMTGDTSGRKLVGNRRLVSVNTKTGQVTSATLDYFDLTNVSWDPSVLDRPFLEAQSGVKGVE